MYSSDGLELSELTMQRLADLIGEAVQIAVETALASTSVTVGSLDAQAMTDVEAAVSEGVTTAMGTGVVVTVADLDMQAINDVTMAIDQAG